MPDDDEGESYWYAVPGGEEDDDDDDDDDDDKEKEAEADKDIDYSVDQDQAERKKKRRRRFSCTSLLMYGLPEEQKVVDEHGLPDMHEVDEDMRGAVEGPTALTR